MDVSPAQASDRTEKSGNVAEIIFGERGEIDTNVVLDGQLEQEPPAADIITNFTTEKSDPHFPAEALVMTQRSINLTGSTLEKTCKLDSTNRENTGNGGSDFIVHGKFEPAAAIMKNGIIRHAGVDSEHPLIVPVDECTEDICKKSLHEVLVLPAKDAAIVSLSECGVSPALDKPESLHDNKLGPPSEDAPRSSNNGNLDQSSLEQPKDSVSYQGGSNSEYMTENIVIREHLEADNNKNSTVAQSEPTLSGELKGVDPSTPKEKRTYRKRFRSTATDRTLRSREKPKAPESSTGVESASTEKEKKRKKRMRKRDSAPDEFSRIRTHLRYILNKIGYEQNLIDAYSAEGWKGLSLEKLKPEKELQRASSEILRCKLRIRDLFQRLDSLCSEGSFPESLFDSKGQIDSEDIYCAKCGSKDLSADNDIILCDGACDRGFHQLCLVPPLLSAEIPPGDESWLCPGCECKDDCLSLLNDSQGTRLCLSDSWEKVFPEAAATAAGGNMQDVNFGYPSDDSEDNDYEPDNVQMDESVEGEESSSDESDFTSTSEEFEAVRTNDQLLGLPSDDSEDAEYDPDAQDHGNEFDQGSSSSDFTSDSEDLDMGVENVEISGEGSKRKESINSEPLVISETGVDSAPISSKRRLERLDYKKLYDETFKDGKSDSSDDEDWTDTGPPTKRRMLTRKAAPESRNGKSPIPNGKITGTSLKQNSEGMNVSPSGRKGPYKRMGDAVTQGLYQAFKENQYPDRSAKENLAKLLGLSYQKVDKWFGNARWSWRHSGKEATISKVVSDPSPRDKGLIEPRREINENGVKISESPQATGGMTGSKMAIGESSQQKTAAPIADKTNEISAQSEVMPTPPTGTSRGKRERKPDLNSEVPMPPAVTPGGQRNVSVTPKPRGRRKKSEAPKPTGNTEEAQGVQRTGRYQTRHRESGS